VIVPWAHGTIVRATRFPNYYDFNLVRVEEDPEMSVDELIGVADGALAAHDHRRFDIESIQFAERVRPEFEARGWKTLRLLWMRFEGELPAGAFEGVEQVPYEAAAGLRSAWHLEDHPDQDEGDFPRQAGEVAKLRGVQVVAMFEGGEPIAYAQVERVGRGAEISQVYVHPDHRGGGRGTAMTSAAILATAGEVDDLWITADDEDRPKDLYARLGFRPAWTIMEATRWPAPMPAA
jgi:GNAT superfamily N-acetyltransferase